MGKVHIVLADDHAILRAGVRMLLESQPDLTVVGEAGDGAEALRLVKERRPELVVLDLTMPGTNGIEATERISREVPETRILVLTMHSDERIFHQVLQAGASGYIVKSAEPEDLFAAVRAVAAGDAYIHPALAGKLIDHYVRRGLSDDAEERAIHLTTREQQVCRLLAEGRTGKEVAELLQISPHTVERHRQKLMRKLGLHGRTALVKYAMQQGLIELDV